MTDEKIVEKLSAAGWVESEVKAVILAIDTNNMSTQPTQPQQMQQQGPKQHLSIRKLPDMFIESVWKKLF